MSCRLIDREEREALYDDFVKLEEARERKERLNAAACPLCGRPTCPSRRWFPEMERFGTCPEENSCRLTKRTVA